MKRTAQWLVAMGALCAAHSLAAQSAPGTEPGHAAAADSAAVRTSGTEIVVTGRATKPPPDAVFDEARGISRVGRYDIYEEALPRFWTPVCPGVAGLRGDYANAMVERMREDLTRLKIPIARGACQPNLVVAFEEDGRSLLSDLQRERPAIFQQVSDSEKTALLTEDAPVHVWNNIAKRWTGSGAPPHDEEKASVWGQLNRNTMPWSFDIIGALVVFDHDAATSLTLKQLADYAIMRGLSHTKPPKGAQQLATILSLFDRDAAPPAELTAFDLGYLRSLYAWQASASAANKLVGVRHQMAKAVRQSRAKP